MIGTPALNARSSMIDGRDDEPCITERGGQASTQCNSTSLVNAFRYKPLECWCEQVYGYEVVNDLDRNTNLNLQNKIKVHNEFVAYFHKVVEMLMLFENMWEGHLGSINVIKHRVVLESSKDRPVNSALYQTGSRRRGLESQEIERMLAMHIIVPTQKK